MEDFRYHLGHTHPVDNNSTFSEDDFAALKTFQLVDCVLNAICSFTASLGNGIVVFVIWKTPSLHSPSNTLLFGLALTDFFVGLLTQPLKVASSVVYLVSQEDGPPAIRKAFDVLSVILTGAAFTTATAIAIDRYLVFYLHMRYQVIITNKKAIAVLVFSWLFSSLFALIWTQNAKAYYLFGILAFVVSFTIIVLMYCKIYRVVRRHRAQIQSQAQVGTEHRTSPQLCLARCTKTAINTFYICFILFLCFFPYACTAGVIQLTGLSLTKYIALEYTGTVTFMNSSLNPLVYFWRIGEIRMEIKRTLKCCKRRGTSRIQSAGEN